jgi:tRNA threonylcarbamoyladenosine biosynthesis protein TsaB
LLVLAIETSARHFTLALLDDDKLKSEFDSRSTEAGGANLDAVDKKNAPQGLPNRNFGRKPGVSVTLLPAIKSLLEGANVQWSDIDLIAIATGPGMFTGLRVGVVAAKTLAYVHKTPLIGVNTLQVLAAQSAASLKNDLPKSPKDGEAIDGPLIYPVLNAQRQQVFSGCYQAQGNWQAASSRENEILDSKSWLAGLTENSIVTGSGLKLLDSEFGKQGSSLAVQLKELKVQMAPETTWDCCAEGVARVGRIEFLAGNQSDVWSLEPFYFRPSTAEEVFAKREKS